ncbi:uncharacterized protein G2W53_040127 [Senna tora]|uniref:Uncharacterized protein n=1 Tax=Senna tora TaxID=362788 RepID=A0A834W6T7_9FABA|nr:uncharacterized protein G2W53_040127 [Senna tora]
MELWGGSLVPGDSPVAVTVSSSDEDLSSVVYAEPWLEFLRASSGRDDFSLGFSLADPCSDESFLDGRPFSFGFYLLPVEQDGFLYIRVRASHACDQRDSGDQDASQSNRTDFGGKEVQAPDDARKERRSFVIFPTRQMILAFLPPPHLDKEMMLQQLSGRPPLPSWLELPIPCFVPSFPVFLTEKRQSALLSLTLSMLFATISLEMLRNMYYQSYYCELSDLMAKRDAADMEERQKKWEEETKELRSELDRGNVEVAHLEKELGQVDDKVSAMRVKSLEIESLKLKSEKELVVDDVFAETKDDDPADEPTKGNDPADEVAKDDDPTYENPPYSEHVFPLTDFVPKTAADSGVTSIPDPVSTTEVPPSSSAADLPNTSPMDVGPPSPVVAVIEVTPTREKVFETARGTPEGSPHVIPAIRDLEGPSNLDSSFCEEFDGSYLFGVPP